MAFDFKELNKRVKADFYRACICKVCKSITTSNFAIEKKICNPCMVVYEKIYNEHISGKIETTLEEYVDSVILANILDPDEIEERQYIR